MISIEEDKETFKRQKFYRPCSSLQLKNQSLSDYITNYNPEGGKDIFWLDYTKLEYKCFTDFQSILGVVADGSMVKVTLRSESKEFLTPDKKMSKKGETFIASCENLMPEPNTTLPRKPQGLANLLQNMVKIAAQQVMLEGADNGRFVPVSSFYYSDATTMFTLTGVVCRGNRKSRLKKAFEGWKFANLTWKPPMR